NLLHPSDQNGVVAAVLLRVRTAAQHRYRPVQSRQVARVTHQRPPRKLIGAALRESQAELGVFSSENVDQPFVALQESRVTARTLREAHQDQGRVDRQRCEGGRSEAPRLSLSVTRGDDG